MYYGQFLQQQDFIHSMMQSLYVIQII